jgi:methyltransferase (TIGR00027 family)
MNPKQASISASGIALARAIESQKPAGERICYDPFARQFIGPLFWYVFRFFVVTGYAERRSPGVMGFLVARERYIDDCLMAAIAEGIDQVVILGAGFDSRAYRIEGLQKGVRVFEVDHPATQTIKKQKVAQIFGQLPEQVTYVPVDFDQEDLGARLSASGYRESSKTFFIWQGVTQYLTPEAIDATLAFIAGHSGSGSQVIFDYMYTSLLDGSIQRGEVTRMRRTRRFTGEGLVYGIPEGTLQSFLEQRGFCQVRDTSTEDLKKTYFSGSNQKREIAVGYAIANGTVC